MNRFISIPVITILTSSENASFRARDAFCQYFGATELLGGTNEQRQHNQKIDESSSLSAYNQLFAPSIVLGINKNEIVLHLLPLEGSSKAKGREGLSILSITQHHDEFGLDVDGGLLLTRTREKLCSYLHEKHNYAMLVKSKLAASKLFQRNVDEAVIASNVFLGDEEQMVLDLPTTIQMNGDDDNYSAIDDNSYSHKRSDQTSTTNHQSLPHLSLKEIIVPFFPNSKQSSASTCIGQNFSKSSLVRPTNPVTGYPMMGLYTWPSTADTCDTANRIRFRPIPAAREDRSLPNPSLVFHSASSLEEQQEKLSGEDSISSVSKVGYSGGVSRNGGKRTNYGQLSFSHNDLPGINFRLCESTHLPTGFPEAQEALLASSLTELQNANVLAEGGDRQKNKSDSMNGLGDCWVEFRANMKHPGGFFGRKSPAPAQTRIAKSPDLPYE